MLNVLNSWNKDIIIIMFIDLNLSIINVIVSTINYDKQGDFDIYPTKKKHNSKIYPLSSACNAKM